jgi:hypothetical protein
MEQELLLTIAKDLEIIPADQATFTKQVLIDHINDLLQHNFQKLVSLLYRLDVSETKLRSLLDNNEGRDAADIITDLIIERQLQKIKSRQQFRQRDNNINEEDKW